MPLGVGGRTLQCRKLARVQVQVGEHHVCYAKPRRLSTLLGEFQGFLGNRRISRHIGPRPVHRGQAAPRPEVPRIFRIVAQQRDGTHPSPFGFDGRVAMRHRAGGAKPNLQIEFEPIALRARFHTRQYVYAAGELQRCFLRCGSRGRQASRFKPCAGRTLGKPGLGKMLRQQLRFLRRRLGVVPFDRFGDPRMELLAAAFQQAVVCGVPH